MADEHVPLASAASPIIALYVRVHLIAPITGQLDSVAAVCIAAAASRPGATKSR